MIGIIERQHQMSIELIKESIVVIQKKKIQLQTIIIKFNITEELGTWFYYVNPVFRFIDFFSGVLLYEIYLRIQQYITRKKATILEFISILMLFIFMYNGISKIPLIYRWDIYYIFPISFLILAFSIVECVKEA